MYLLVQQHNYRCVCYSVAIDSNISAGRCNSNRHACCPSLTVTDVLGGQGATAANIPVGSKKRLKHGYCNISASLVKLLQT